VRYRGAQGIVGLFAPSVHFTGPVFIGNVNASGNAIPVLRLGSADDVRITGGNLHQVNGQPVLVSGIPRLQFVAGQTAHGSALPARRNLGALVENGLELAARIAINQPSTEMSIAMADDDGPDDDQDSDTTATL
jgi:hypothetical protein